MIDRKKFDKLVKKDQNYCKNQICDTGKVYVDYVEF